MSTPSNHLTVLAINCTLKRGKSGSSTEHLLQQVLKEFASYKVKSEVIRAVNHDIYPGVLANEGKGDAWPAIRQKILAADILLIGTPIWMGHPSSICQRVMERLDAFLDDTDPQGRMRSFGKVAIAAIVGNEDGAHAVSADLFQGLNDVGFTIPATGVTYWVGEAMGDKNYIELKSTPRKVAQATQTMVRNAVHLAQLLKNQNYPGNES